METPIINNIESRISTSKINTYQQCPLKYKVLYIDKVKDVSHPSAFVGMAVHKVLELLVKERTLPDIKKICTEYNVMYELDLVKELVKKTIKNNYLANFECIKDVEYKFDCMLSNNITRVVGIIDRLDIINNKAVIIDIKTGNKPYTKKELKDNIQSKIYHLAINRLYPDLDVIDVIFWFVKKQERQLVTLTKAEAYETERSIIKIDDEIRGLTEYVPKKNKYCTYCVNYHNCPLFKK